MSVKPIKAISKKTGKPIKGYDVDVTVTRLDGTKIRKQKRLTGYYKRDAEQYESELKGRLMRGDIDGKEEKTVPTLDEFKDVFMKNHVELRCRPKEQRNKEGHFRLHLLPHFGGKPMDQISERDIDDYIANKRDKLAPKTINEHLSTLNLTLKLAKKYKHIDHIPAIEWLPLKQKERTFLPFDIAEKLINAADDDWRAMITTALKTGLRMGELLGLRWEAVDFETGYLTVKCS
jgi:integrase